MSDEDDLSEATVSSGYADEIYLESKEEVQRQAWKGTVFWICSIGILLTSIVLFAFLWRLFCTFPSTVLHGYHIALLGLLFAFPALLTLTLVRMVQKPTDRQASIEDVPSVALAKALADAVVEAIKALKP
ncbi:MAG: hypothetical protein AAF918_16120 [Pseudomonadota bacterium]